MRAPAPTVAAYLDLPGRAGAREPGGGSREPKLFGCAPDGHQARAPGPVYYNCRPVRAR